jgi:hypothetical protein
MSPHTARIASGVTITLLVATWHTPLAQADPNDGVAINGTYTAFSDGQWAQTNQSYHDEASVTQTWTITSTCATFIDCAGQVTSDQGWAADLKYTSGTWRVRRTLDNWEHCIDGTAVPGEQTFTFWPEYPPTSQFVGRDLTIGPSGGCGYNKWLNITLPLRLTPVG